MATTSYSAAVVLPGLAGFTNTVKNPARVYGWAGYTTWCAIITGTEATIECQDDFGAGADNGILVSVDGGSFVVCPHSGATHTLFTGLSDTAHTVCVVVASSADEYIYFPNSGNIVSVTGAVPDLYVFSNPVEFGESSSVHAYSGIRAANQPNYTPLYRVNNDGWEAEPNVCSIVINGDFTYLAASANATTIFVSVDGGVPDEYPVAAMADPTNISKPMIIPVSAGQHTYAVWDTGRKDATHRQLSLASNGTMLTQSPLRLDQYGTSITYAEYASTRGNVETMQVAAYFNRAGSTLGVPGATAVSLYPRLVTSLPLRVIETGDVAVLELGRNSIGSFTPIEEAAYHDCVDILLSYGYSKVLCRGILPEGAEVFATENAIIESIVDTYGDEVVFIDTSAWSGIATADGVHPTDAGYLQIAAYAIADYPLGSSGGGSSIGYKSTLNLGLSLGL